MEDNDKKADQEIAFRNAYKDGQFFPFKYMIDDLAGSESDVDFEDWVSDLDLNKTQLALLKRMLTDIDVSVGVFWEDDEHFSGINLSFFSMPYGGALATANLSEMVADALAGTDSSSLDAAKKFRDMVAAETEKLEKRIATGEVP